LASNSRQTDSQSSGVRLLCDATLSLRKIYDSDRAEAFEEAVCRTKEKKGLSAAKG
jgi:hypothetical protein